MAFFDVDGTIIARDSFLFIIFSAVTANPLRCLPIVVLFPVFLATALFHLDKRWAKSIALWAATVGRGPRGALRWLRHMGHKVASIYGFQQFPEEVKTLRKAGITPCYISASGTTWLWPLVRVGDPLATTIVGTPLAFRWGGVVARGPNCYGKEKIRRIASLFPHRALRGYSDHVADTPLLAHCQTRFAVNPKSRHWAQFLKTFGAGGITKLQWTAPGVGPRQKDGP